MSGGKDNRRARQCAGSSGHHRGSKEIDFLGFPAESAGTEDGSVALLELRDEELGLAFVDLEDVLLHVVTDGVHQEVTSLGETTEEDDRFGRGEGDEVRAGFTEDSPRRLEDLESETVASRSRVKDVLTRDRVDIQITERALVGADSEVFASRTCYT